MDMNKPPKDKFTKTNNKGPRANYPLKYLTVSSVIGDKVQDENNEDMGEIKDVMLDLSIGEIGYFVIKFGGFLGIGVKYFAVPFDFLRVDPKNKKLMVDLEKKMFELAPGFDLYHWLDNNLHLPVND